MPVVQLRVRLRRDRRDTPQDRAGARTTVLRRPCASRRCRRRDVGDRPARGPARPGDLQRREGARHPPHRDRRARLGPARTDDPRQRLEWVLRNARRARCSSCRETPLQADAGTEEVEELDAVTVVLHRGRSTVVAVEARMADGRLRELFEAGIALNSELSLDALLQKLVETAAPADRRAVRGTRRDRRVGRRARALRHHRHRRGRPARRSATCRAAAASSAC